MNKNKPVNEVDRKSMDNANTTDNVKSPRQGRLPFSDISNTNICESVCKEPDNLSQRPSDNSWIERTEENHENYKKFASSLLEDLAQKAVEYSSKTSDTLHDKQLPRSIENSDSEYESASDMDDQSPSFTPEISNVLKTDDCGNEISTHKRSSCIGHSSTSTSLENTEVSNKTEKVDKEIRGALELLKSFEKLGVSSPNTCRVSLQRAHTRVANNSFNPFSSRSSVEPKGQLNLFQDSFDNQTTKEESSFTKSEVNTPELNTQLKQEEENLSNVTKELKTNNSQDVQETELLISISELSVNNVNEEIGSQFQDSTLSSYMNHESEVFESKPNASDSGVNQSCIPIKKELNPTLECSISDGCVQTDKEKLGKFNDPEFNPFLLGKDTIFSASSAIGEEEIKSVSSPILSKSIIDSHLNHKSTDIHNSSKLSGDISTKTLSKHLVNKDMCKHDFNHIDAFIMRLPVQDSTIKSKDDQRADVIQSKDIDHKSDPFATKSTVQNVIDSTFEIKIKGTSEDDIGNINDQFATKPSVDNSPMNVKDLMSETENETTSEDDIDNINDPFATKSLVQNSPMNVKDPKSETENKATDEDDIDNINDSLATKSAVKNSAFQEIRPKFGTENKGTSDDIENINNTFATKSSVQNSPMTINDTDTKSGRENKGTNEDDIGKINDPFATKSSLQNSPLSVNNLNSENENIGASEDNTEDINDLFATKSSVQNSLMNVKDPKSETENEGTSEDDINNINDPFVTKSLVQNSPMNVKDPKSGTVNNNNNTNEGDIDNINDPFATKSSVQNSPMSVKDPKSGTENEGTSEDDIDNINDPLAIKSAVKNSPMNVKDQKSGTENEATSEDDIDNINDPFVTKSLVQNSLMNVKDPKSGTVNNNNNTNEGDIDINDPFATKSSVQNSPMSIKDTNSGIENEGTSEDDIENIIDPFATNSSVQNSPVSINNLKCGNENRGTNEDNIETINDPFATKLAVQNSPVKVEDPFIKIEWGSTSGYDFDSMSESYAINGALKKSPLSVNDFDISVESDTGSFVKQESVIGIDKPGDLTTVVGGTYSDEISLIETNIESQLQSLSYENDSVADPGDWKDINFTSLSNSSNAEGYRSVNVDSQSTSYNEILDESLLCNTTVIENTNPPETYNAKNLYAIFGTNLEPENNTNMETFHSSFDILDQAEEGMEKDCLFSTKNPRKSISSMEFDVIAQEGLRLTKKITPEATPLRNYLKNELTISPLEVFSSSKDFFSNEEELDALSCFGKADPNENLVRNSLFIKFDPLIAASMDNALDTRRESSLISFSPYKKAVKESPQRCPKLDATVNDTTVMDETLPGDVNTTILVRTDSGLAPGLVAEVAVQTVEEMVSSREMNAALRNKDIVYEEILLRKSQEIEEMKMFFRKELESRDTYISSLEEEERTIRNLLLQYKELMQKIVEKKSSMEGEFEDQIRDLKNEHCQQVQMMKEQQQQQEEDLKASEQTFFDLVRKHERLRQIDEALNKTMKVLVQKNADLEKTVTHKEESFAKVLKEMEEKMKETELRFLDESKHHQNEKSKAALLMKRAEMKVISLSETVQKKEEEIRMLSSLLDDYSKKFDS